MWWGVSHHEIFMPNNLQCPPITEISGNDRRVYTVLKTPAPREGVVLQTREREKERERERKKERKKEAGGNVMRQNIICQISLGASVTKNTFFYMMWPRCPRDGQRATPHTFVRKEINFYAFLFYFFFSSRLSLFSPLVHFLLYISLLKVNLCYSGGENTYITVIPGQQLHSEFERKRAREI